MAQITYSNRNNPTPTQGTVEPIKVQASTHGALRSEVGNPSRVKTPITTPNATLDPNQAQSQGSPEAPKSPTVTEDPLISSKFAALARKEKAIRQRYQEIQAKEAEMKSLHDEIAQAKAYRERLKSAPLDVLNEEGITYDQLVQRAVNPTNPEVSALQAQVKALEESLKRQQEESQKSYQTQREQAEKQISMDVQSLISSDPAYETVKDMGAEEAITQLITTTYDEEGVLLTVDQAAKQVNDYLISEIDKINGIPSVKKRLSPTPQAEEMKPPVEQKTIKTLSNAMSPTSEAPARTWAQKKAQIVAKYSKKG